MNNYAEELVPTTVVDNFFETPSLVRNLALHQDYWKCTEHPNGGNWPGKRTRYINEIDPVFHEIVCKKLIRYLPHHVAFEIADMTFHISDAINSPGWIHTDPPHLGIGAVIYLNEGIKQSTGTCLYDVPSGFNGQGYEEEFQRQLALQGTPEATEFEKYKEECNSMFQPSVTVEARYNRCVIFDGRKYHGGMNFYGSNVDDARLTIVFFGRGILSGV
jgi:hypothetical protein